MISTKDRELIEKVTDFNNRGAYSVRRNAETIEVHPTNDIDITKIDGGLQFDIHEGKKDLVLSVPAIITKSNVQDKVLNTFNVADNSEVLIVAGCAIDNDEELSTHSGLHKINIGKNCKVRYVEQHIGQGKGHSNMNTETYVNIGDNSTFEMDTTQIEGIYRGVRDTHISFGSNSVADVKERIMTFTDEKANTRFTLNMNGEDSKVNVVSRSVAVDNSYQTFESEAIGYNRCYARVECDGIIKDKGRVDANPKVKAIHPESELIHEAAIGRIAGEQLMKLMTLGLNKDEAELEIINGFLR